MKNIEDIIQYNRDLCKEENHPYPEKRELIVNIKGTYFTPIYCANCETFLKYDIPNQKDLKKYEKYCEKKE